MSVAFAPSPARLAAGSVLARAGAPAKSFSIRSTAFSSSNSATVARPARMPAGSKVRSSSGASAPAVLSSTVRGETSLWAYSSRSVKVSRVAGSTNSRSPSRSTKSAIVMPGVTAK